MARGELCESEMGFVFAHPAVRAESPRGEQVGRSTAGKRGNIFRRKMLPHFCPHGSQDCTPMLQHAFVCRFLLQYEQCKGEMLHVAHPMLATLQHFGLEPLADEGPRCEVQEWFR